MIDKIYKAMVGNDTDGNIYSVDVIRHDGKLWLVPHWLEAPSLGVSKPARIVRFDNQQHQYVPAGGPFGEYVLNGPVPKALLEMTTPKQQAFSHEYVEMPEIEIPASVRPIGGGPHLH